MSTATSAYDIWHTLEVTYEGTSNVKETNNNFICYGCNKPRHMKNDCHLLRSMSKSTKFNKKRKALTATWDDSDESSSDEEFEEKESAHMCFMAQDDVSENEELLDAFNELYETFVRLKTSHNFLKGENKRLLEEISELNSSTFSNSQEIELKEENYSLLKENECLSNENKYLKSECNDLNIRINNLEKDISSFK